MQVITLNNKMELKNDLLSINNEAWPKFMLNWDCSEWSHLFSTFAKYQILLLDEGKIMAFGHTIPLSWDKDINVIPDDMKTLVEMGVKNYKEENSPNILLALAAVVSKDYTGRGLSFEVIKAMKDVAVMNNMRALIVPVRPTLKHKYPLIPMSAYVEWNREDGLPFDSWLRVHKKLGGEIFKIAEQCMTIKGSVKDWEEWTGLKMLGSGEFIIEGALNPVNINIDKNIGEYADPCIWIKYNIE